MKKFFIALFVLLTALLSGDIGYAQTEPADKKIYYEKPSVQKLAELYWAISKFGEEDQLALDNFLFINECDLYNEFYHREFEWKDIREAGLEYIRQNKRNFPLRFEFIQPVHFKEYSFERGGFEVHDDYKILGTRRFEVQAVNSYDKICGNDKEIVGYPKMLVLEFSRPFSLEFVPVEPEIAKTFIDAKAKYVDQTINKMYLQESIYESRDAYMVMNVKIYAYKGETMTKNAGMRTDVLAVLEGIDVYSDPDRQMLLFSETYRQRKKEQQSAGTVPKGIPAELDLSQPLLQPTRH